MDHLTNNVKAQLASKIGTDVVRYVVEPYLDISKEEIATIENIIKTIENCYLQFIHNEIKRVREPILRQYSDYCEQYYSSFEGDGVYYWNNKYSVHLFIYYLFSDHNPRRKNTIELFDNVNTKKHALKFIDSIVLRHTIDYDVYQEYKTDRWNIIMFYKNSPSNSMIFYNLVTNAFTHHARKTNRLKVNI